ncbi:MAG: sulfur carrier protein ThiS adenylyltransferase ThiF [Candidatus Omnitrophota bacterium]
MNAFETKLCEQLGKESFDKVQRVKVGIAGLGGLGSNSAMNLVRSGFRKFLLVDFDRVETANLNRQFYFEDQMGRLKTEALEVNLKRINPVIEIETCSEKVERSNADRIFNDCDVIVEAFDKAEYKSMLVEKMLVLKKFIVSASGLAGIGNSDDIKVHRAKKNLIIIGDLTSDVKNSFPISPRVNVAAAKQADVVLSHVIAK